MVESSSSWSSRRIILYAAGVIACLFAIQLNVATRMLRLDDDANNSQAASGECFDCPNGSKERMKRRTKAKEDTGTNKSTDKQIEYLRADRRSLAGNDIDPTRTDGVSEGESALPKNDRKISTSSSPKLIWGIHSGAQQTEMRGALRDAYLKDPNVCSVRELQNVKNLDSCDVIYTFLVTKDAGEGSNAVSKPAKNEEDVVILKSPAHKRGFAWLQYASKLMGELGLDDHESTYVIHTNSDIVVWPQLIIDAILRKDENPYQYDDLYPPFDPNYKTNGLTRRETGGPMLEYGTTQLPFQGPQNGSCIGSLPPSFCKDPKGRIMLFSKDLAKIMGKGMDDDDDEIQDAEMAMLKYIKRKNFNISRRYALGFYGAYHKPSDIRDEWHSQSENRKFWKSRLAEKAGGAKVAAITAKFGKRPGLFAQTVALHKYVMVAGGLEPRQITAYDSFTPEMIHDPRWKRHLAFLYDDDEKVATPRGGGYWFWKPVIILEALKKVNDGDFVFYCDVDTPDDWNWIPNVIERMHERNHNVAVYRLNYPEQKYVKRDIYDHYCPKIPQSQDTNNQLWGSQLFLRKSPGVMDFIQTWVKDSENYHFLSDSPSVKPNIEGHMEHRHDQSIMSLLLRCRYRHRDIQGILENGVPYYVEGMYSMGIEPWSGIDESGDVSLGFYDEPAGGSAVGVSTSI